MTLNLCNVGNHRSKTAINKMPYWANFVNVGLE
jgi:hypothetical protein